MAIWHGLLPAASAGSKGCYVYGTVRDLFEKKPGLGVRYLARTEYRVDLALRRTLRAVVEGGRGVFPCGFPRLV